MIILLCGPAASGKSTLRIALSKQFPSWISSSIEEAEEATHTREGAWQLVRYICKRETEVQEKFRKNILFESSASSEQLKALVRDTPEVLFISLSGNPADFQERIRNRGLSQQAELDELQAVEIILEEQYQKLSWQAVSITSDSSATSEQIVERAALAISLFTIACKNRETEQIVVQSPFSEFSEEAWWRNTRQYFASSDLLSSF